MSRHPLIAVVLMLLAPLSQGLIVRGDESVPLSQTWQPIGGREMYLRDYHTATGGRFAVPAETHASGGWTFTGVTFIDTILIVRGKAHLVGCDFRNASVWVAPGGDVTIEHCTFTGDAVIPVQWKPDQPVITYAMACVIGWNHQSLVVRRNTFIHGSRQILVEGRTPSGVVGPTTIEGNRFGENTVELGGDPNRPEQVLFHGPGTFGEIVVRGNAFTWSGRYMDGDPRHAPHVKTGPHRIGTAISVWELTDHGDIELDANWYHGDADAAPLLLDYMPAPAPAPGSKATGVVRLTQRQGVGNGKVWNNNAEVRWPGRAVRVHGGRDRINLFPGVYPVEWSQ